MTWLSVIGLMTAAATPAMAQVGYFYNGPAPSYAWQNPDGSYQSYGDFSMALWGTPCGIECQQKARARWGIAPPPPHPAEQPYYYNYDR